MKIGGIIDISTKDIPNKAATVIFTGGCNFKCNFCHNKSILQSNVGNYYTIDELVTRIKNNVLVNSVSISGGEPTLQEDLIDFCKELSKTGKFISLDTNGSNPEVIKELIPYINRIALDIKTALICKKIERIIGLKIDPEIIIKTYNIINQCKEIEFEIRTTYVENLFTPKDIHEIILFLRDRNFSGNYVLQQYQYSNGVGEEFKDKFRKPNHFHLLNILKPFKDVILPFKLYLRDDLFGYSNVIDCFYSN